MITAKESKKLLKKRLKQDFENEKEKIIKVLETKVDTFIRDSASQGYRYTYFEFVETSRDEYITPTTKNAKFIKQYLKKHGYKAYINFKYNNNSIAESIKISW